MPIVILVVTTPMAAMPIVILVVRLLRIVRVVCLMVRAAPATLRMFQAGELATLHIFLIARVVFLEREIHMKRELQQLVALQVLVDMVRESITQTAHE